MLSLDMYQIEKIKIKIGNKAFLTKVLAILLLITIAFFYYKDYRSIDNIEEFAENSLIKISASSGCYADGLQVKLSLDIDAPIGTKIYYSLDGEDPRTKEYNKIILLPKETGKIKLYVLKVAAKYKNQYSKTTSCTYLVGDNVDNYYGIDIISITADEKDLYDYKTGILTNGVTYDENMKKNPDAEFIEGNWSQRGDEWIRRAQLTMFSAKGELMLNQKIGIAVSGNTSSADDHKSLKIISSEKYDLSHHTFNYCFSKKNINLYSQPDEYHSLRLRSGSQDINHGNIRSSVASRLCEQAGLDICCDTNRVVLFLNNKCWGIYDMQQTYSNSYLAKRFSLPNSEQITKLKGNEIEVTEEAGISKLLKSDLSIEENRNKLEQTVDMDNYLYYYAAEILMNNNDWPLNNFEMWKYDGVYDVNNPYTDGRYRFLVFDMDLIYYTQDNEEEFFEGCKANILDSLMNSQYRASGSSFTNIMKCEKYRNLFCVYICDLINTAFDYNNVALIVDEENAIIRQANEICHSEEENTRQRYYSENIKKSAKEHQQQVYSSMKSFFGLDKTYELNVISNEGTRVFWNKNEVFAKQKYVGKYFCGVDFQISAESYPNYQLIGFEVNGELIESDTIIISNDLIKNGTVTIKTISRKVNNAELLIEEVSAKSDSDWIKVRNYSSSTIDLSNYYISDKQDKPLQYNLPRIKLQSGDTFVIYCSDSYMKNEYKCNFNLSDGESLLLYSKQADKIVDNLYIPNMGKNETYGRFDNCDSYRFYNNIYGTNK